MYTNEAEIAIDDDLMIKSESTLWFPWFIEKNISTLSGLSKFHRKENDTKI